MAGLIIRPVTVSDRRWCEQQVCEHFATSHVVSRGRLIDTNTLPGWIAHLDDEPAGVLLIEEREGAVEVVVLIAALSGQGVGKALLAHVVSEAMRLHYQRLWLITTNNNVGAIRFYESLGWRCAHVHKGAVSEARRLKPEIPRRDEHGAAICDEWEFEYPLQTLV